MGINIKRTSCVIVITLQFRPLILLILSIEMDPNLLLLIMMTTVLYFFTKICLAVITAGQQRVFAVQAPEEQEDQTINRRAENRVHPQPQENDE